MTASDEQSVAGLSQESQQAQEGQTSNGGVGSSSAALQSELIRPSGEAPPPLQTIASSDAASGAQSNSKAEQKQSTPVKGFNSNNFYMVAGERGAVNAAPRGTFSKPGVSSGAMEGTPPQSARSTRPSLGDPPPANLRPPSENGNGVFSGSYELSAIKDENPLAKYAPQENAESKQQLSQNDLDKLWAEKHQLEQGHWGHISEDETNDRIEKINDQLGLHDGHRTYYSS